MEWIAVSIGIGLLVSLLFTEAFGLNVGGMIVPGYLAMSWGRPLTLLLTLAAALTTWACVRLLHRWTILYGRRRVALTMVVGFAIAGVIRWSIDLLSQQTTHAGMAFEAAGITVIGFVIPGLIALWIDRTGIVHTLSPLIVATTLVRLVLVLFAMEAVV